MNRSTLLLIIIVLEMLTVTWVLSLGAPTSVKAGMFRLLGVSAPAEAFSDLRVVLAWQDCYRAGEDLSAGCSSAPLKMPLNYPRTWLLLSGAGLGAKDTLWIAGILELAFFLSALLLAWGRSLKEIWPLLVLLPSQPIWLALERCNADLLVFPLVVALGFVGDAVAFALISAGISLKLYPIGAAAVFWSGRIKVAAGWLAAMASVLILFLLTPMADLHGVIGRNVLSYRGSFGWRVLPGVLDERLSAQNIHILPAMERIALVMMVLILLGGLAASRLSYVRPEWSAKERRWLQASLGLYVACYVIGYNFDYRYIFILPALPAIGAAIRQKGWRSIEGLLAALCMLMLWLTWDRHLVTSVVKELIGWTAFGISVPMLLWSRQVQTSGQPAAERSLALLSDAPANT